MNDILLYLLFSGLGVLAGILSALLGIGGGIVFIPTLFLSLSVIIPDSEILIFVAVSTSLFAGSFTSLGSFYNHFRIKNIDKTSALLLVVGTLIASLIIPQFVVKLPQELVKYFISGILFLIAIKMFFDADGETRNYNISKYLLFPLGIIVGSISAIGGFGGGIFFVPILHYLLGFNIKRAIGTSTFPVAVTMIGSTLSYAWAVPPETFSFQLGYIHLLSGLILGISSVTGTFIGIRLINRFRNDKLKKVFSVLILIMVVKIIF